MGIEIFALDGVKFTVMCFCDQINTGIGLIDNAVLSTIFFDPIRIKQNFLIFFFIKRLRLHIGDRQALKGGTLVPFCRGKLAVLFEQLS